jgi:hypothetical protein
MRAARSRSSVKKAAFADLKNRKNMAMTAKAKTVEAIQAGFHRP